MSERPQYKGPPIIDHTGQRFGRLYVQRRSGISPRRCILWECLCDCGKITYVSGVLLRRGETKSCGCLRYDTRATLTHGKSTMYVDGKRRAQPEYDAWIRMKHRCQPGDKDHRCYYDRGIRVCSEWENDFMSFYRHIGPRPSSKHSVDRIDNDRGYEPGNVRWATRQEQSRNSRVVTWITFRGETKTVGDWAKYLDIKLSTLTNRLNMLGWSVEDAFTTVVRKCNG